MLGFNFRCMKTVLFFILVFPLSLAAQTVHLNDKEIEYKDKVKTEGLSDAEVFQRVQEAVKALVNATGDLKTEESKKELKVKGEMRLSTPYPIIRKVEYSLEISVKDNGYNYKIDDVSLWEKHRGDTSRIISSKDLVEQLDESGTTAIEAEKILNAIDLNLQKLLRLIENKIRG